MLKSYSVLSGLYGLLDDDKIVEVKPEYRQCLLDLAQANAIYPDTFNAVISNYTEWNRRRDEKWRKENPNVKPGMGLYPPSIRGVSMGCNRPCTTVQIGSQLFFFDVKPEVMFEMVLKEKDN